jgi:GcrA cell cycle regulator
MSNYHPQSPWDDSRIADLRRLHAEGLSANQIGERLGFSRSAVIGKWYREGLSRPKPVERPGPKIYAQLRAEGVTIKEIAARFGMTRNGLRSALSKYRQAQERGPALNRQRVRSADATLARNLQRLQNRKKARPPSQRRQAPSLPPAIPPDCIPITLMDLAGITGMPGTCRWPLAEPAGPLTLFCGSGRDDIHVYCPFHCRTAYRDCP